MTEKYMSLIGHLEDLRKMIIRILISFVPASVIGWFTRDYVLNWLLKPVRDVNPDFKLSTFGVVSPFFVYLKIAMAIGLVLALPYILYQVWIFIVPALKTNERKALRIIIPSSVLLFLIGIAFAYFAVFQVGVKFFWAFAQSSNIATIYSMDQYLSFSLGFLLPFGFIFELPIVVLVLAKMGIVSPRFLAGKRKFAILIIFFIAAILTPGPDVVSQLLMAAPMYLLFEISILLARFVYRKKEKAQLEWEQDELEPADDFAPAQLDGEKQPELDGNSVEEPKAAETDQVEVQAADTTESDSSVDDDDDDDDDLPDIVVDYDDLDPENEEDPVDTEVSGEEQLKKLLDDIEDRGKNPSDKK